MSQGLTLLAILLVALLVGVRIRIRLLTWGIRCHTCNYQAEFGSRRTMQQAIDSHSKLCPPQPDNGQRSA